MEQIKQEKNLFSQEGKVLRNERYRNLGQQGLVVWFTGLSASGKTTIAIELEKELFSRGKIVYRLDGDNIRKGLTSDLRFSESDRNENIRRIAEVAALFLDAGLIVLVSFISPYKKMREFARSIVGKDSFIEVYVKADLGTCIRRDPKGLYTKALKGEIPVFTGISDIYEEPLNPDLILDTAELSVETTVKIVLDEIMTRSRLNSI